MTPQELEELVVKDNWRSLLLDLMISNELDPWDVDVDALARAFLERVKSMGADNFYIPANIVLALAIVLKYKSMSLAFTEEEEPLPEVEELDIGDDRIIRKRPKIPITLVDIFEKIEETIQKIEAKTPKRKKSEPSPEAPVLEINPEDVKKEVEEIYTKALSLSRMGKVYFSTLASEREDIAARTLLSLLFLSNEGRIELKQERVFEDIEVLLGDVEKSD